MVRGKACLVWVNAQVGVTRLIVQTPQTEIEEDFPVTGHGGFLVLIKLTAGSRNSEKGMERASSGHHQHGITGKGAA